MTAEFREHEWQKLYTKDEELTPQVIRPLIPSHEMFSYAGIDRCKHCRIIRVANPTLDTWYMKPNWDMSGEEPHCVVKDYEEILQSSTETPQ